MSKALYERAQQDQAAQAQAQPEQGESKPNADDDAIDADFEVK